MDAGLWNSYSHALVIAITQRSSLLNNLPVETKKVLSPTRAAIPSSRAPFFLDISGWWASNCFGKSVLCSVWPCSAADKDMIKKICHVLVANDHFFKNRQRKIKIPNFLSHCAAFTFGKFRLPFWPYRSMCSLVKGIHGVLLCGRAYTVILNKRIICSTRLEQSCLIVYTADCECLEPM